MINLGYVKRLRQRCLAAEAALADAQAQLEQTHRQMMDRAVLISITKHDGDNRFTFLRNGKVHWIDTYSTMSDTPDEWRRALLERQ